MIDHQAYYAYHAIAQTSEASQDKTELEELLGIVGNLTYAMSNPTILEIGVDQGYSLDIWGQAFNPRFLAGIDIKEPQRKHDGLFIKGSSQEEWMVELVKHLFDRYGKEINFLFIDGDHTYGSVKRDFELYSPLVSKGGVIAFHDARITDNDTVEVYKFWNEIKDQYKHKEIFSSTGTGTGVIWI